MAANVGIGDVRTLREEENLFSGQYTRDEKSFEAEEKRRVRNLSVNGVGADRRRGCAPHRLLLCGVCVLGDEARAKNLGSFERLFQRRLRHRFEMFDEVTFRFAA